MKVGYFGIKGSYSYFAALEYFGGDCEAVPAKKFSEVFDLVKKGEVEYGVVPIENSLAGSVHDTYDLLNLYDVHITGEVYEKIDHCLLGFRPNNNTDPLHSVHKVHAHPQALAQCSQFFEKNSWLEKVPYGDNASAAAYVSERGNITLAAIASKEAGTLYGLQVLKENIADSDFNITRFVVISKSNNPIDEADKCSLIFTVPHTPGSLVNILSVFSKHGCNLSKIESRPIKDKTFEYLFYVDAEFKHTSAPIDSIIAEFKKNADNVKVLGVYKSSFDRLAY
jgi:prephenate dehydratase